jgi:hypothetical protein
VKWIMGYCRLHHTLTNRQMTQDRMIGLNSHSLRAYNERDRSNQISDVGRWQRHKRKEKRGCTRRWVDNFEGRDVNTFPSQPIEN